MNVWPAGHPALTDEALRPHAASAAAICPAGSTATVLKYQPARRVTSRIDGTRQPLVLKLYASRRAHKTYRRLGAFATTSAAVLTPFVVGIDASEHACLVEFVAGEPLDRLEGARLVTACRAAGESLHRLHGCGARLDRVWTLDDEIRQLRKSYGPHTQQQIEQLVASVQVHDVGLVASHRDCYAAQAVVLGTAVRWIDLDDAALAPPGLDAGNFIAHLIAHRPPADIDVTRHAAAAFLDGYGEAPADIATWIQLSLARLAGLAERRNDDPDDVARLLAAARHPEHFV